MGQELIAHLGQELIAHLGQELIAHLAQELKAHSTSFSPQCVLNFCANGAGTLKPALAGTGLSVRYNKPPPSGGGQLDSSVLADATLKDTATRRRTKSFLRSLEGRETPQYALKEISAGPMRAYVWFHNVLATERSYDRALGRLHRRSRTPDRNQTSSAIEALRASEQMLSIRMRKGIYPTADSDRAEDLHLGLRKLINAAWLGTKTIPDRFSFPIRCHALQPPVEGADGLIKQSAHLCEGPAVCDQANHLRSENEALALVYSFLESNAKSAEDERRRNALLRVRMGERMNNSQSRSLGDAVCCVDHRLYVVS